jgi:hypothetical protein
MLVPRARGFDPLIDDRRAASPIPGREGPHG